MKHEIRLTGGIYNNHQLIHKNLHDIVRATKVTIRRILFDIANNYLNKNFTFMDVCAGYGTVGLEALSREASLVVFCDINKKCIDVIRKNVELMPKIPGHILYIQKSALKITPGKAMDCVFIDPPYASAHIIIDIIHKLHTQLWINEHTLIIFEVSSYTKINECVNLNIFRYKKIGNTVLYFCGYIN